MHHARAGLLELPSAANNSPLELLVSQKVYRAVGGSLWVITAGRTRFRLTRKFEGLRDSEINDVMSWFEDLPWQVETFEFRQSQPGTETLAAFPGCRVIGPPKVTKGSFNDWDLTVVIGFPVLPVTQNANTGWNGYVASPGNKAPFITLGHPTPGALRLPSPANQSEQETDVNQSLIESPAGVERGWQRGQQYYRIGRKFESLTDDQLKRCVDWFEAIDWQGSTFTYRQVVPGHGRNVRTSFFGVRLWGIPKVTKVCDNIWDVDAMFEFPTHPNIERGS